MKLDHYYVSTIIPHFSLSVVLFQAVKSTYIYSFQKLKIQHLLHGAPYNSILIAMRDRQPLGQIRTYLAKIAGLKACVRMENWS